MEAIQKVSPSTHKSLTQIFKNLGGYIESMGAFTISIMELEGEETPLTQEREESWDEHWRIVNQQFEESLALDPDWGPYLSQKLVHILDGNNRHNAWMDCISTFEFSSGCYDFFCFFVLPNFLFYYRFSTGFFHALLCSL